MKQKNHDIRHIAGRISALVTVSLFGVGLLAGQVFSQGTDAVLKEIVFSKLPGDEIQINMIIEGVLVDPGSFSTNNPPRIAFDFFGMTKSLEEDVIEIDSGAVDSVVAVETDDRTRVVINLTQPARYRTSLTENGFVLTIDNTDLTRVRTVSDMAEERPFTRPPDIISAATITNIDFRRSPAGGGKIIVDLSDPTISVDMREEGGELVLDFLGATIGEELERRLDVVDFATPVLTIDAFRNGGDARMVIVPTGRYQHLSYQTGNQFTLIVDPYVETEEDRREQQRNELGYSGDRLSINFQKIDVRSALTVIADFTGMNFVTSDRVGGELTLSLKDVPWDQALDVIMQTQGLAMRQTGNVVWVAPAAEIAETERLALEANRTVADLEPLVSDLIQVNYAKAADIAAILKSVKAVSTGVEPSLFGSVSVSTIETESNSLLSSRGNVTVDERTNNLLIQDTARKIVEIRKLVAELDRPVRQVMIETRIVEATDTFSRNLGARLGLQRVTENAEFPGVAGSNIGNFTGSGTIESLGRINEARITNDSGPLFDSTTENFDRDDFLQVDLGSDGIGSSNAATYAFQIFKAGTGFAHLLSLELSALQADGRGKVIASPRLITANQKEAHIEQGQERLFALQTFGSIGNLVTKKAVLSLTVTPQITPDDRVIMDVIITQDSFVSADADTLNTKEIFTQVLAENGETIVIGGIYQQEEFDNTTQVPILGDIPILGRLFKKRSQTDNRIELLIFLTPRIISPKLNLG